MSRTHRRCPKFGRTRRARLRSRKKIVLRCFRLREGPPCEPVVEAHYREGAKTAKYARWLHDVIGKRMISPFKLADRRPTSMNRNKNRGECPPMPAGLGGDGDQSRRHYVVASTSTIGPGLPDRERIRTTALHPYDSDQCAIIEFPGRSLMAWWAASRRRSACPGVFSESWPGSPSGSRQHRSDCHSGRIHPRCASPPSRLLGPSRSYHRPIHGSSKALPSLQNQSVLHPLAAE